MSSSSFTTTILTCPRATKPRTFYIAAPTRLVCNSMLGALHLQVSVHGLLGTVKSGCCALFRTWTHGWSFFSTPRTLFYFVVPLSLRQSGNALLDELTMDKAVC